MSTVGRGELDLTSSSYDLTTSRSQRLTAADPCGKDYCEEVDGLTVEKYGNTRNSSKLDQLMRCPTRSIELTLPKDLGIIRLCFGGPLRQKCQPKALVPLGT